MQQDFSPKTLLRQERSAARGPLLAVDAQITLECANTLQGHGHAAPFWRRAPRRRCAGSVRRRCIRQARLRRLSGSPLRDRTSRCARRRRFRRRPDLLPGPAATSPKREKGRPMRIFLNAPWNALDRLILSNFCLIIRKGQRMYCRAKGTAAMAKK